MPARKPPAASGKPVARKPTAVVIAIGAPMPPKKMGGKKMQGMSEDDEMEMMGMMKKGRKGRKGC